MNIYAKYQFKYSAFSDPISKLCYESVARAKSQERLCRLKKDAKIIASQHGELHLANFLRNTWIFNIYLSTFQYLFDTNMLGLNFYNKFILLADRSSKIANLEILYIYNSIVFCLFKYNFITW